MLASWNDGAAGSAIVDFVARVTRKGGRDYVPPAERIATFDNDSDRAPAVTVPYVRWRARGRARGIVQWRGIVQ